MQRIPVESTTLAALAYDRSRQQLELEFHNGSVYHYRGVPERTYQELSQAPSKGQYFNRNIRGQFPTSQASPSDGGTR